MMLLMLACRRYVQDISPCPLYTFDTCCDTEALLARKREFFHGSGAAEPKPHSFGSELGVQLQGRDPEPLGVIRASRAISFLIFLLFLACSCSSICLRGPSFCVSPQRGAAPDFSFGNPGRNGQQCLRNLGGGFGEVCGPWDLFGLFGGGRQCLHCWSWCRARYKMSGAAQGPQEQPQAMMSPEV